MVTPQAAGDAAGRLFRQKTNTYGLVWVRAGRTAFFARIDISVPDPRGICELLGSDT